MEGGQEDDFPPDLLQAIIAKMSFRSVYKAATLSKQWNTKFLNSQNSSSWFRRELHSSATNWPTFSPMFIRKDAKSLLAFNRATSNWLGPISLDQIPAGKPNRWRSALLAGSLLLCQIGPTFFQFFITNILTKTCRTITLPSDFEFEPESVNLKHYPDLLSLIPVGSDSYILTKTCRTITLPSDFEFEPESVNVKHYPDLLSLIPVGSDSYKVRLMVRYRWSIDKLSFSGDADFVYFGRGFVDGSVFKFDLKRREWSSIPAASDLREEDDDVIWAQGAFEPGLNPFVSA